MRLLINTILLLLRLQTIEGHAAQKKTHPKSSQRFYTFPRKAFDSGAFVLVPSPCVRRRGTTDSRTRQTTEERESGRNLVPLSTFLHPYPRSE